MWHDLHAVSVATFAPDRLPSLCLCADNTLATTFLSEVVCVEIPLTRHAGPRPIEYTAHQNAPEILRFLDYVEDASLLKVAPPIVQDVIVIGTNCGIRIASKALTLTWENVDFLRNLLTLSAAFAKVGETRSVPLNSRAREVLVRRKAVSRSQYVFSKPNGLPYKSMDKLFTRTCLDAGLAGTGLSLHSLRHTFASRLVMSGADLRTVKVLGGWRDLSLVQRYRHLSPGHCTQAIERIAQELFPPRIPSRPETGGVVELAERRATM